MATTTPNFGWAVPTSTDLVKDGAVAIETLGDSIDASLVDLKGGTTGQVLAKATGTDMDFTWATPAAGSSNVAGKNGVLNSNFSVWQRGTSFSFTNAQRQFTSDRWEASSNNGTGTVSRQTTSDTTNLPFIQYCTRFARTAGQTGTGGNLLGQNFESVNSIPFSGKTIAVSYYARAGANFSGTFTPTLVYGTGTDQNVFVGLTGQTTLSNTAVTLTTTWQRFSFSVAVPSTSTQLAFYFNGTGAGTAGANDYYEVTGVQLEIASAASAYSPNAATFQGELAACQRYYQRLTSDTNGILVNYAFCSNSTLAIGQYQYIVPMRAVPTSLDSSSVRFRNHAGSAFNMSSILFNEASAFAAQIYGTISGGTAEQPGSLLASATPGFIGLSAEL
jgi:hypothetical protein